MSGFDDYHAYKSTSSGGGGGNGRFLNVVFWISLIAVFLWVIGKYA